MTAEAEDIEALWDAQAQITSAIALLDKAGAPPHIAAHLDLAHHQLTILIEDGAIGATSRRSGDLCH
jgi:dTDP-4-amino-4,6-dideoxygalactose transaminase